MTAATLKTALPLRKAAVAKSVKTGPGLFQRLYNAMIEAQLRKAEREIHQQLRLVPDDILRQAGFRRTLEGSKDLPFVK